MLIHSGVSKKQKGMVLILVLSLFAFAAVISGELSYQSHREVRRTSNIIDLDEAYLFAKGGETFAIQKLLADFQNDIKSGLIVDYLTEAWSIQNEPFVLDSSDIDKNALGAGDIINADDINNKQTDPLQDIGKLSIVIEDLQGRFNVNNVQYNKTGQIKGIDQFENVINAVLRQGVQGAVPGNQNEVEQDTVGQEPYQTSQLEIPPGDLVRAVQDWVDTDDDPQLPAGSEDNYYSQLKTPYRTASKAISDVSELMAIRGFSENQFMVYRLLMPKRFPQPEETQEEQEDSTAAEDVSYDQYGNVIVPLVPAAEKYWGGVKQYISALPFPSTINVNTASVAVLQALFTEEQANTIVQNREDSPYQKVDDIFLNLQTIKKDEDKRRYTPYLSVNSQYFLSTVTATIGETKFVLRSTLYRDLNGNVHVIKRTLGR